MKVKPPERHDTASLELPESSTMFPEVQRPEITKEFPVEEWMARAGDVMTGVVGTLESRVH